MTECSSAGGNQPGLSARLSSLRKPAVPFLRHLSRRPNKFTQHTHNGKRRKQNHTSQCAQYNRSCYSRDKPPFTTSSGQCAQWERCWRFAVQEEGPWSLVRWRSLILGYKCAVHIVMCMTESALVFTDLLVSWSLLSGALQPDGICGVCGEWCYACGASYVYRVPRVLHFVRLRELSNRFSRSAQLERFAFLQQPMCLVCA